MQNMTGIEEVVADYYERIWSRFALWWEAEETLGLHYALYEKGIKNFSQAVLNMSDYVGRILDLDETDNMKILDAGCGIGGTSIYLAKKYPNLDFTGITITPGQYVLANKFSKQRNVSNTDFLLRNYMQTEFSDQYFHNIFALESVCYSRDKYGFIKEMKRILKPGGKIAVVDVFFVDKPHNFFMKKLHDLTCNGRGIPVDEDLILKNFVSDLKKEGFTNIKIQDLSKKVARSQFRSFLIGIPFFFASIFKFILSRGKIDLSKDPNYYLGTSVFCAIYGLFGIGKYAAITAIKK